jgi:TFIIF-interacting CTD phosphatase-like protein
MYYLSLHLDLELMGWGTQEANRLETQTISRLLTTKKLSLIVDLDQTIVHATVDPTVGEWLDDERNPNYPALVGVEKFRLGMGEPGEEDGCYYYVKMRCVAFRPRPSEARLTEIVGPD